MTDNNAKPTKIITAHITNATSPFGFCFPRIAEGSVLAIVPGVSPWLISRGLAVPQGTAKQCLFPWEQHRRSPFAMMPLLRTRIPCEQSSSPRAQPQPHFSSPAFERCGAGAEPFERDHRSSSEIGSLNGAATAGASPNGVSNISELVGDFTKPILKPEAAESVKRCGELSKKAFLPHAQQPVLTRRRALRVLQHRHANAAPEGQSHDSTARRS
jgi:hypothetical protein